MAAKTRADLLKRLDPYWKMEAANVVFVPVFLIWLAGGQVGWISLVPLAATVLLLVIEAGRDRQPGPRHAASAL